MYKYIGIEPATDSDGFGRAVQRHSMICKTNHITDFSGSTQYSICIDMFTQFLLVMSSLFITAHAEPITTLLDLHTSAAFLHCTWVLYIPDWIKEYLLYRSKINWGVLAYIARAVLYCIFESGRGVGVSGAVKFSMFSPSRPTPRQSK